MKNPFSRDFKPEAPKASEKLILPVGAYVCGVIGAKADDKQLTIQLEITEGPLAGFFKQEFDSQDGKYRTPKYKGQYVLRFPDGRSEQGDQYREREARGVAWAFEQSNPGYRWQWETIERDLKNKAIGINVRERDWAMKGDDGSVRTGTTWEIGRLEDVNAVKREEVKPMKKRELSQRDKDLVASAGATPPAVDASSGMYTAESEELPF